MNCKCEQPVINVEHDSACRRCGLPVNFAEMSPPDPGSGATVRTSQEDSGRTGSRVEPYWNAVTAYRRGELPWQRDIR